MPPKKKPVPVEAPLAPDDMPPIRAGKPDASVAYYGGPLGARVTYTDPQGVPHAEECAANEVRATTVRLAREFGKAG